MTCNIQQNINANIIKRKKYRFGITDVPFSIMLHHFGQFDGSFTLKVVMETKHVAVS